MAVARPVTVLCDWVCIDQPEKTQKRCNVALIRKPISFRYMHARTVNRGGRSLAQSSIQGQYCPLWCYVFVGCWLLLMPCSVGLRLAKTLLWHSLVDARRWSMLSMIPCDDGCATGIPFWKTTSGEPDVGRRRLKLCLWTITKPQASKLQLQCKEQGGGTMMGLSGKEARWV